MDYRKLTRSLIARVRELQNELNEAYDSMETAGSYHEAQNRRLHADLRQAEHERNQARTANSNRQFARDHALRDLEMACRRGDDWGQRRALNRLRDL